MEVWLTNIVDRYAALSVREQGLIGLTGAVMIGSILQFLLVDPLLAENEVLKNKTKAAFNVQRGLSGRLGSQGQGPRARREEKLKEELRYLTERSTQTQEQVALYATSLVPPQQMPALLRGVLGESNVELVGLINGDPVPLVEVAESDEAHRGDDAGYRTTSRLYQHSIEVKVRGDFYALRAYLLALERQPWKYLWESMKYRTSEHPKGVLELKIQTLSTEEKWLGL